MDAEKCVKLGQRDRLVLNELALQLSARYPNHEPSQKFAFILSTLMVVDVLDLLDEMHAVVEPLRNEAGKRMDKVIEGGG